MTPLELARAVVASIRVALAGTAYGVESGLHWAAMVTEHPGAGTQVWVTTSDGPWLPPVLYLPSHIALPWWPTIRPDSWHAASTDPVRPLVEAAHADGATVLALATTREIHTYGPVAAEGIVTAHEHDDAPWTYSSPGPGLSDRYHLTVSESRRAVIEALAPDQYRAQIVALARDAHTLTPRDLSVAKGPWDARTAALTAATSNSATAPVWTALDGAHAVLVTGERHTREHGSSGTAAIPVGGDLPTLGRFVDIERERWTTELVAILAGESAGIEDVRQATYLWSLITRHTPADTR